MPDQRVELTQTVLLAGIVGGEHVQLAAGSLNCVAGGGEPPQKTGVASEDVSPAGAFCLQHFGP